MSITTSLKSESDLDLNKDCSNLRSNFKPSTILIGYDSREINLSRTRVCGLSNSFLNFRILPGSSTGSWGLGLGLLLLCMMLEEAINSQWSDYVEEPEWSRQGKNKNNTLADELYLPSVIKFNLLSFGRG